MHSRHISLLVFSSVLIAVIGGSLYYLKKQIDDEDLTFHSNVSVKSKDNTQANLNAVSSAQPVLSNASKQKKAHKDWTTNPVAKTDSILVGSNEQMALEVNKRLIRAMDALDAKRTQAKRLLNDPGIGVAVEETLEVTTKHAANIDGDLLNALDSSLQEKIAEQSSN